MVGDGDLLFIQLFHQVICLLLFSFWFLRITVHYMKYKTGATASGEVQSERFLLARPSVSVVACLLDPLIKYLCSQSRKARLPTRLAMALAGCAQRSGSLSMKFK